MTQKNISSLELTSYPLRKPNLIKYYLPFFCAGWIGSSLIYLNYIFSGSLRWFYLVFLFVFIVTRYKIIRYFDARLAFLIFIYTTWCLLTILWSNVPMLSLVKSVLFTFMIPILVLAGIEWVKNFSWDYSLDYLWMLSFCSLLSALLGHNDGSNNYYHGLIMGAGSNLFGFMAAVSFPFFLWMTYRKWNEKNKRYIWLACTSLIFYYTFISMSRASILIMLSTLFCFFVSSKFSKKIILLVGSVIVSIGLLCIYPSLLTHMLEVYTVKTRGSLLDSRVVFHSRYTEWQQSHEGAVEGGWVGLGFGVSFDRTDWDFKGFNSIGYGREKGNSPLGIIEETGLIGFLLYIILLGYLLIKFINLYITTKNHNQKILIAIFMGTFIGLIFHSMFECWWYAPGGPEFLYFWLLIGASRGLELSIKNHYAH